MSDDLVKRLKETIKFGLFDAPNPVTFDECLAEIEYLRADLASACSQLREAALDDLAYLGQYTDWQSQAAEREAAAFRAGAEAMREAAIIAIEDEQVDVDATEEAEDMAYNTALSHAARAIRALPLPAHQSSTGDAA